jgi:hypothetical protein
MQLDPPATTLTKRGLEHYLVLGLALGALAVLIVLGVFVEPDARGFGTHERLGLPPCKPMEWWNVPCPGCGVTTSVALAAHGALWSSFKNQPFGLLIACAIPVVAVWALNHHLRGRDLNVETSRIKLGWPALVVGVLMVGSWIYKLARVRGWL